jgi:hypothetical protein
MGVDPAEDDPEGVTLPDELWSHAMRASAAKRRKKGARMVGRLGVISEVSASFT